ncbi:MAG: hypothetical protein ACYTEQ_27010 [Planctomycetota bacterium]
MATPKPYVLIVHKGDEWTLFDLYADDLLRDVANSHPALIFLPPDFGAMTRYKLNPRWDVDEVEAELRAELDRLALWDGALDDIPDRESD